MSDLYTSQVHLKRLLAGQATPAFTPAPEAVLKMLDPEFFPGMGALNEDEHGLLRCPVRGCGEWVHSLARHANNKHDHIGGAVALRSALDIPRSVALVSRPLKQKHLRSQRRRDPSTRNTTGLSPGRGMRRASMVHRNFSDTCPAQLQAKLHDLRERLGRSPSINDFAAAFGEAAVGHVQRVFGSWNAAKATCGLETFASGAPPGSRVPTSLVVESLRAWVEVHGDLPNYREVRERDRAPIVCSETTIKRAMGVDNWTAAMRSVGESLGIKSERYGFDFRKAA